LIGLCGFLGGLAASLSALFFSWKTVYVSGAVLGFMLLFLRASIKESPFFLALHRNQKTTFIDFFSEPRRPIRLLLLMGVGLPVWYVAGVLNTFAPELGKSLEVNGSISAASTLFMKYIGCIAGDLSCGLLSQKWRSRKKPLWFFLILGSLVTLTHPLWTKNQGPEIFYLSRALIGFFNSFLILLVGYSAELVGTNFRASMTTWLANLIRASSIPLTLLFQFWTIPYGSLAAAWALGFIAYGISLLSLYFLPETFSRKLDTLDDA
jgi:hypothetical protein